MSERSSNLNPFTTLNIREIRTAINDLQGGLRRIVRDGYPNEAQREAIEEAVRLLGLARDVLARDELAQWEGGLGPAAQVADAELADWYSTLPAVTR